MPPNPTLERHKQIVELAFHVIQDSVKLELFLKEIFKNCKNVSCQSLTFVPKV